MKATHRVKQAGTYSFGGPSAASRSGRMGLLRAGSALAAVLAIGSGGLSPLHAQTVFTPGQNVRATAEYNASQADFQPGTGQDVVEMLAAQAIINWTTFDAGATGTQVTFLGTGSNLAFTSSLDDYTVLNRVFTPGFDSAIRIDGTINSTVAGGTATGGNIWFYSPGGIIAGSSSVFNVGSLVLSTSSIDAIGGGGSTINFGGTSNPGSAVVVENGASINALAQGSYIAMFAPRVEQRGTVTVDGSAAYIGAEQGQLQINNGLFDISISVGTENGNGVVHSGTTTGPASQAVVSVSGAVIDADARAIYLVAVPKNDVITMLVSGNIGYAPAVAAARSSNGHIVLSAGADVADTSASLAAPDFAIDMAGATGGGGIDIGRASFSSGITAFASGDLLLQAGDSTISIGSDARENYSTDFSAGGSLILDISSAGSLQVDGDLNLRGGTGLAAGAPVDILINEGFVSIGGILNIEVAGISSASLPPRESSLLVTGSSDVSVGTIRFAGDGLNQSFAMRVEDNSVVDVVNDILLDITGVTSGAGSASGGNLSLMVDEADLTARNIALTSRIDNNLLAGQDVTGGNVEMLVTNGARAIAQQVRLSSFARTQVAGSAARGGDVSMLVDSARLEVDFDISLNANGLVAAGDLAAIAGANSATAFGGSIDVTMLGEFPLLAFGSLLARADGSSSAEIPPLTIDGAGDPDLGNGADSFGGSINFTIGAGTFEGNFAEISASGYGVRGSSGILDDGINAPVPFSGIGGDGIGGIVSFNLDGGIVTLDSLTAFASGLGGDGAASNPLVGLAGGNGGIGTGGNAAINASAGTLDVGSITLQALGNAVVLSFEPFVFTYGNGGSGGGVASGDGGAGFGGTTNFNLTGTANVLTDNIFISAAGYAGQGGFSSVTFDPVTFDSIPGGAAGVGGTASGGEATFNHTGGTASFNRLTVDASARGARGGSNFGLSMGADADGGAGGAAIGGIATINLEFDDLSNPIYSILAGAVGGDGGSGVNSGDGGNAIGGEALLNINNVEVSLQSAVISAQASGGNGGFVDSETGSGGAGGNAVSGVLTVDANGANAVFSSLVPISFEAEGFGGTGADGSFPFNDSEIPGDGGAGGDGTGGAIRLIARDGASISLFDAGESFVASGRGGAGGSGGSNFFGGDQGSGGAGGSGTGGVIALLAEAGSAVEIAATASAVVLLADGTGGLGGNGGSASGGDLGALGANGDSFGGNILLEASGAGAQLLLDGGVIAFARGISSNDFRVNAAGSDATGGQIELLASGGGLISVTDDALLDTSAIAGNGHIGAGAALGGDMLISATDGSRINLTVLLAELDGLGGAGAESADGIGGEAGSGTGGNGLIFLDDSSILDVVSIQATAQGSGGLGGTSGFAPAGGAGGAGVGGSLTLQSEGDILSLTTLSFQANGFGGGGGSIGGSGIAGAGGAGFGGQTQLLLTDDGAAVPTLGDVSLSSTALGGTGGFGGNGDSAVAGGLGGSGGLAQGGSALFELAGNGASMSLEANRFAITAGATGGQGGGGGGNFAGGQAGTGGAGGEGIGGAVALVAGSGAELQLIGNFFTFNLSSLGRGGAGGAGGNFDQMSGGLAGTGGDGGAGIGGTPRITAQGGTITAEDLLLGAFGIGGAGGTGGGDFTAQFAPDGNGGNGIGGRAVLEVLEGSPGILNATNVLMSAGGFAGAGQITGTTFGGAAEIIDLSTDPAGLITLGNLTVSATGDGAAPGGGLFFTGGSGATTLTGILQVDVAGDINFAFANDGQLQVGGATTLFAGGSIAVTHANNPGDLTSLFSGGSILALAGGDFTAATGSIVAASNELSILAGGNIDAADLRAVPFILLQAGGNVLLEDAAAIGPQGVANFGGIIIDAGIDFFGGSAGFDPSANAAITGTVQSYSDVIVTAGGNVTFAGGSETRAGNSIRVSTGDDILVEDGAVLLSALNPSSPIIPTSPFSSGPNIWLEAGSVPILSTPLTPIASVVVDGLVNANGGSVILTGNAIDAVNANITGASLRADINNAPASGILQSDDNGLLSPFCLAGNVCLGSISATNRVEIGQASNNDVIQLIIEQGTVNAGTILVTTRSDVVMGSNGISTALNGSNAFTITSLEGNVDLRDAAISSSQVLISAGGSLLGTAAISSTGDVGISVGQDLNATSITAGGQLTSFAGAGGALETDYSVPGSIVVGSYSQGGAARFRVVAGGTIDFGTIAVPTGQAVELFAGVDMAGDVLLGSIAGASGIVLSGDNVFADDLAAALDIEIIAAEAVSVIHAEADGNFTATAGTTFFTSPNSLITGGDIIIDAGGIVDLGNSQAGGLIDVNGTQIDFITLEAGETVSLLTQISPTGQPGSGNITGEDIVGGTGASSITAGFGAISIANSVAVAGSVALAASDDIEVGSASADSFMSLNAGGNVTADVLSAGGNLDVAAGQLVVVGSVSSGSFLDVAASQSITIGELSAAGALLFSSDGPVAVTDEIGISGLLTAQGSSVTLRSTNDLAANITAVAGAVDAETSGSLDIQGATAAGNMRLATNGQLSVSGDAIASGDLNMEVGGLASFAALAVGEFINLSALDIDISSTGGIGQTNVTRRISMGLEGSMLIGGDGTGSANFILDNDEFSRVQSGGDLSFSAVSITLDTLDIQVIDSANSTPQAGNIGQNGSASFNTLSAVNVIGAVTMRDAGLANALNLVSSNNIFIDANGGLLQIVDSAGGYTGTISLLGNNFYAMTSQARTDIQNMTIAQIDERLANNDGLDIPDGLLRSSVLEITTIDSEVFIQNTGTGTDFDARRGFTAAQLFINDSVGPNLPIVINGVIGGATGVDAVGLAILNAPFDTGSTINGCLIGNPAACLAAPPPNTGPDAEPVPDPIREFVEEQIMGPGIADGDIGSILMEMRDDPSRSPDPLIDEPVTGAGNEDLWVDAVEECVDEDGVTCSA